MVGYVEVLAHPSRVHVPESLDYVVTEATTANPYYSSSSMTGRSKPRPVTLGVRCTFLSLFCVNFFRIPNLNLCSATPCLKFA